MNVVVWCVTGRWDDNVGLVHQELLLTDERQQLVNIIREKIPVLAH